MNMKKSMNNRLGLLLLAATLVAGCAKEENSSPVDPCTGRLAIGLSANATVETRAENTIDLTSAVDNLKIPYVSDCNVTLRGSNITKLKVDENGDLVTDPTGSSTFEDVWAPGQYDKPGLDPGDYTVLLSYGEASAIGENLPYYTGEASTKVTAGKEVTVKVPLKIRNTAIRVQATPEFLDYFDKPKARLVVNGVENEAWYFSVAHKEVIFVPASAKIGLKISGIRPSQNGKDEGSLMEWTYTKDETLKGGSLYTFKLHANAGKATVTVTISGYEETIEVGPNGGIQTNPDAQE